MLNPKLILPALALALAGSTMIQVTYNPLWLILSVAGLALAGYAVWEGYHAG